MNIKFNYQSATNGSTLTQQTLDLFYIGSNFLKSISQGTQTVSGTYNISTHFCLPSATARPKAVQFLTHGLGFDGFYWDFASGYSYVDTAAAAGFATFFYDRLGVGNSSHPDPVNVVQYAYEVEVAHQLAQMVAKGTFADHTFSKVVGIGHSFGSKVTEGVARLYPSSLAAAVLTDFTVDSNGTAAFVLSQDVQIAAQADPRRFSSLSPGYIVAQSQTGFQQAFLHAPGFDAAVAAAAFAATQPNALGEAFTQGGAVPASAFTGPAAVVAGAQDLSFCDGNCTYPYDKPRVALDTLFPATRNGSTYVAPDAGHGLNLHYSAAAAFDWINNFLVQNGISP